MKLFTKITSTEIVQTGVDREQQGYGIIDQNSRKERRVQQVGCYILYRSKTDHINYQRGKYKQQNFDKSRP